MSALLRLPLLSELRIDGCFRINSMDKMRLVAKVKAGASAGGAAASAAARARRGSSSQAAGGDGLFEARAFASQVNRALRSQA